MRKPGRPDATVSLRELFPRCERLQADAEKLLTANLRLTEAVNPLRRERLSICGICSTPCTTPRNASTGLIGQPNSYAKRPMLSLQKARMDAEFMRAAFMKEQTECNSKVVDALREKLLEAEKATHP